MVEGWRKAPLPGGGFDDRPILGVPVGVPDEGVQNEISNKQIPGRETRVFRIRWLHGVERRANVVWRVARRESLGGVDSDLGEQFIPVEERFLFVLYFAADNAVGDLVRSLLGVCQLYVGDRHTKGGTNDLSRLFGPVIALLILGAIGTPVERGVLEEPAEASSWFLEPHLLLLADLFVGDSCPAGDIDVGDCHTS